MGAALYNYYKHGELKSEGSSITEGIGQGRITANLEGAMVDDAFQIPDSEAIPVAFDLLQHEGLCMGGSTGVNVAGAIRMAKAMGPGHTIVTILCDYGTRYASKLFNPAFLLYITVCWSSLIYLIFYNILSYKINNNNKIKFSKMVIIFILLLYRVCS